MVTFRQSSRYWAASYSVLTSVARQYTGRPDIVFGFSVDSIVCIPPALSRCGLRRTTCLGCFPRLFLCGREDSKTSPLAAALDTCRLERHLTPSIPRATLPCKSCRRLISYAAFISTMDCTTVAIEQELFLENVPPGTRHDAGRV